MLRAIRRRMVGLAVIAVIAAAIGVALGIGNADRGGRRAIITGPHAEFLVVEIADTPTRRGHGLSGRRALESDGLLLVFDSTAQHGIWMQGMEFDLDLLWLDESGQILAIQEGAEPCVADTCPIFTGEGQPARFVLELTGGYAGLSQWAVGDYLFIQLPGEQMPPREPPVNDWASPRAAAMNVD